MEEQETENKVSRFSSGLNILQRLDTLWKNCHDFKRRGLYHKWNEELDTVWLELARDLSNKTDFEKYNEDLKSIDDKIKLQMPFQDLGMNGFHKPTKEMIQKRNNQYELLMIKQLFLARLENYLGKGTSWEEEDDDF